MVKDMFELLRLRERFSDNTLGKKISISTSMTSNNEARASSSELRNVDEYLLEDSAMELQAAAGWLPLMPFFPWQAEKQGWTVPFSDRDWMLRDSSGLRI